MSTLACCCTVTSIMNLNMKMSGEYKYTLFAWRTTGDYYCCSSSFLCGGLLNEESLIIHKHAHAWILFYIKFNAQVHWRNYTKLILSSPLKWEEINLPTCKLLMEFIDSQSNLKSDRLSLISCNNSGMGRRIVLVRFLSSSFWGNCT